MHSRSALLVVLAFALLAGCSSSPSAGGERTTNPSATKASSTDTSSPGASRTLQIGKVTVYVCESCIRAARAAGADLPATITHSIQRIDRLLSLPTAYVNVTADPKATIPGIGVGGESLGQDVPVALNPHFGRFAWTIRVWLPITLAHELDETKRELDGPGGATSLLDWLVTDGLADHFALQAFPDSPPSPWDHALSRGQEGQLWKMARHHLDEIIDFSDWFFGSLRIPHWAGYTLGFHLVGRYLARHPGTTAADLTSMDAERILRGSGFDPNPGRADNPLIARFGGRPGG
jgi:Predicted Zn-dependent protease (DUF2268)